MLVPLLAASLSFMLYAITASPALGWLDSPEFVAASVTLGVPHSPGHPLPVLAGYLGTLLPVGDLVFRVNLVSALASAGAAACMAVAARRILDYFAPALPRMARLSAATAVALLYALSWSAWFQAVRAEVYALEALLHGAVLALVTGILTREEQGIDARGLYAASLLAGLALATHPFIALTAIVPGAAVVLVWRRPGWTRVARVVLFATLGLAALLQTPIRASQHPLVSWGAPHTAERFLWTVSARAFHKATTYEHASPLAEDLAQTIATMIEQATWVVFFAALLGLYAGLRRGGAARQLTTVLAGVLGLALAGRVLIGFDPNVPDDHGYVLPALSAVLLLGLVGLATLAEAVAQHLRPRVAGAGLVGLLALLVPWQLARFLPAAEVLASARASDRIAHWQLDGLPPRTLLLSAYFETRFRLWALQAVEARRPDVDIIDRSFLTYPGMAEEARREHPALADLIDAPLAAGAPLPAERLRALARSRPVRVELHPNLDAAADPWLLPAGPFAAIEPDAPAEDARAEAERRDRLAATEMHELLQGALHPAARLPAEDARVASAMLWHDFTRLVLFCRQGRLSAA
ncbi:MAG TPA: DUF2723 domain-containing protein, partial [Haliangium sp.]|nr:DUF2723 domain-containing protein [Haliangium sp.]